MNQCSKCAEIPFSYSLCDEHYAELAGIVNMPERLDLEDLKILINQFLWVHLPPSSSLEEAEAMARDFFGQIQHAWNKQESLAAAEDQVS